MARDFGNKKLKRGEIILLSTIWQIQHMDNFERGVHREEILKAAKWRKAQFDSYLNDLRTRSKTQYVVGRTSYSLASKELVTTVDTAKILSALPVFAKSNKNICHDMKIPLEPFITWTSKERGMSKDTIREILEKARIKKYILKRQREENKFYIESGPRIWVEEDWIAYLIKQDGKSPVS